VNPNSSTGPGAGQSACGTSDPDPDPVPFASSTARHAVASRRDSMRRAPKEAVMDFVPCPRCQEMNPPSAEKCAACGASMDEAPVEVAPLALAQEPEAEPEEAAAASPGAPAPPPGPAVAAPPPPAGAPPLPASAPPPPRAAPAAPAAHAVPRVELPADAAAQVAALEQQITARPNAKALYIKLADIHQQASTSSWPTSTSRRGRRTRRSTRSSGSSAWTRATLWPGTASTCCAAPCTTRRR